MSVDEETLSETTRKYYVLRYALIGIVLVSALAIATTTSYLDSARIQRGPPAFLTTVVEESDAVPSESFALVKPGLKSIGLLTGGLLVMVGLAYATYTRRALPGFMKGYVEEQAPFWNIRQRAKEFTIQMNGHAVLVRFFSKRQSRWGGLRIELPLATQLSKGQVTQICEQNGIVFSEEDNLISTVTAPEELNWKLLQFSRVIRQIKALEG